MGSGVAKCQVIFYEWISRMVKLTRVELLNLQIFTNKTGLLLRNDLPQEKLNSQFQKLKGICLYYIYFTISALLLVLAIPGRTNHKELRQEVLTRDDTLC